MTQQTDVKWMIVMTQPGAEHDACWRLRKRHGIRAWLWTYFADESFGPPDQRVTRHVLRPYFSRYLFVHHTRRIDVINDTPGIAEVLFDPLTSKPMAIADRDMQALAANLDVQPDGLVPPATDTPDIAAGSELRIKAGPFADLIGRLAEAAPLDGSQRIKVLIDLFGRSTLTELEPGQVDLVSSG